MNTLDLFLSYGGFAMFVPFLALMITGRLVPGYVLDDQRGKSLEYEIAPRSAPLRSPRPGEPTICLLDHRHTMHCPGMRIRTARTANGGIQFTVVEEIDPYVDFDADLAEIGVIEPLMMDNEIRWTKVDG